MPIEIFNMSYESTQNKQLFDTKITCIEERERKGYGVTKLVSVRFVKEGYSKSIDKPNLLRPFFSCVLHF